MKQLNKKFYNVFNTSNIIIISYVILYSSYLVIERNLCLIHKKIFKNGVGIVKNIRCYSSASLERVLLFILKSSYCNLEDAILQNKIIYSRLLLKLKPDINKLMLEDLVRNYFLFKKKHGFDLVYKENLYIEVEFFWYSDPHHVIGECLTEFDMHFFYIYIKDVMKNLLWILHVGCVRIW